MATPSTYAHFENAVPTGDNGLAVGASGSEVTVADSNGRLYSGGSVMFYNAGSAADLRIATGTATMDDVSADITTGLTTIVAAIAIKRGSKGNGSLTSSLDPVNFGVWHSGGTLRISAIRFMEQSSEAGGIPTVSTTSKNCSVDWIAIGT
ncbi:MAG: hypothetical protein ACW99U_20390 [Candidatus Thorarchaeota archaeon]|jgi:hypothetical protein